MDAEMIVRLLILFGIMFFCLFLRFPIAISIFLASAGYAIIFWGEVPAAIIGQGMVNGISSQTIVSILFYFLLGEILNKMCIRDRPSFPLQSIRTGGRSAFRQPGCHNPAFCSPGGLKRILSTSRDCPLIRTERKMTGQACGCGNFFMGKPHYLCGRNCSAKSG